MRLRHNARAARSARAARVALFTILLFLGALAVTLLPEPPYVINLYRWKVLIWPTP